MATSSSWILLLFAITLNIHSSCAGSKKVKWLIVPERLMESGFEPFKNFTTVRTKKTASEEEEEEAKPKGRNFLGAFFNFGGSGTDSDNAANRVVAAKLSEGEGMATLVKAGDDLAAKYGVEPSVSGIYLDNRCKKECKIVIRCLSPTRDSGSFRVSYQDGYVLKFLTPSNPSYSTNIRWTCEIKDLGNKRRIIYDVYGRSAPVATVNLYEIRDKGLVRLDDQTARLDARQPMAKWIEDEEKPDDEKPEKAEKAKEH